MYKRRSTKGQKRGPYRRYKNNFDRVVAEVFGERLNELGITQMQLIEKTGNKVTQPTLSRLLNCRGATSINTMATVADMLGLEIIFRPKQKEENEENN